MVFGSKLSAEVLAVYGDELRSQFDAGGTWYAGYTSFCGAHPELAARVTKFVLRKIWEKFRRVNRRPAASLRVRVDRVKRRPAASLRVERRPAASVPVCAGRTGLNDSEVYPASMTGRSVHGATVTLGLDVEWGNLIATGLKSFDCRPALEPFLSLYKEGDRVCFQVGGGRVPWYILCDSRYSSVYPSLRDMLSYRRSCLLPLGPDGMGSRWETEDAVEYFKGLSEGYSAAADGPWLFFRTDVIGIWCGWA
jgi:hypothetical protein